MTISKIISGDIPFFLTFYLVVLLGYAGALCAITMGYDTSNDYGFYLFFAGVYDLIQITVNQGLPAASNFQPSNVPPALLPLYDIVFTTYYLIVVLIFINILIAMINNTYSVYQEYNDALLLLEKYNIMSGMDVSFFWLSKYYCYCTLYLSKQ